MVTKNTNNKLFAFSALLKCPFRNESFSDSTLSYTINHFLIHSLKHIIKLAELSKHTKKKKSIIQAIIYNYLKFLFFHCQSGFEGR